MSNLTGNQLNAEEQKWFEDLYLATLAESGLYVRFDQFILGHYPWFLEFRINQIRHYSHTAHAVLQKTCSGTLIGS
jgi:hypothetical protein